MSKWKLIDASGLILGRLCSKAAKLSLLGEQLIIINAKDVQISGRKNNIIDHYLHYKKIKTHTNHRKGPFRVGTRPDIFIRKSIKPMLPKNERGKQAIARIHVYINDMPETKKGQYGENLEKLDFSDKFQAKRLGRKMVSVGEVCEAIGWNKGGMK